MSASRRQAFSALDTDAVFLRYLRAMERVVGPVPFPMADTPLFLDERMRRLLGEAAQSLCAQLSAPALIEALKAHIPPRFDAPGMDALPDCVQVDFALVHEADGELSARLVELQAFPSLYALQAVMGDAWAVALSGQPGFEDIAQLTTFYDASRDDALALIRGCLLGDADPFETALVDYQPAKQKTAPDFAATAALFGVQPVCVTQLVRQGRALFRPSGGRLVPVRRIYNRMVFDELEVKQVELPFSFTDDLDVSWCSHPNWYWVWSKAALPHLQHPLVPRTRLLSEVLAAGGPERPLEDYVLKPLFSYAGSGVVLDVTVEGLAQVPEAQRHGYVLQEKFRYADVVPIPERSSGYSAQSPAAKAEVRVMLVKQRTAEGERLRPIVFLVRMSRGRMLGVDQNRGGVQGWVGGTTALFG